MIKLSALFFCAALLALAQDYKLEPIATPPPGLPAAYAAEIQSQGYRINGASGPWCEIWFRKAIPTGAKPTDPAIVFPIAQGTLIAVLRFPKEGADRRGQAIKPGVYTLRYSNFPTDGAHQGVAPQRCPTEASTTPRCASRPGTSRPPASGPARASVVTHIAPSNTTALADPQPPSRTTFPALTKEREHDTPLSVKAGDLPIIILAG